LALAGLAKPGTRKAAVASARQKAARLVRSGLPHRTANAAALAKTAQEVSTSIPSIAPAYANLTNAQILTTSTQKSAVACAVNPPVKKLAQMVSSGTRTLADANAMVEPITAAVRTSTWTWTIAHANVGPLDARSTKSGMKLFASASAAPSTAPTTSTGTPTTADASVHPLNATQVLHGIKNIAVANAFQKRARPNKILIIILTRMNANASALVMLTDVAKMKFSTATFANASANQLHAVMACLGTLTTVHVSALQKSAQPRSTGEPTATPKNADVSAILTSARRATTGTKTSVTVLARLLQESTLVATASSGTALAADAANLPKTVLAKNTTPSGTSKKVLASA
jgi:hypothetical protein